MHVTILNWQKMLLILTEKSIDGIIDWTFIQDLNKGILKNKSKINKIYFISQISVLYSVLYSII